MENRSLESFKDSKIKNPRVILGGGVRPPLKKDKVKIPRSGN